MTPFDCDADGTLNDEMLDAQRCERERASSDTPRTDAVAKWCPECFAHDKKDGVSVTANFARTLERELAAAQLRIVELEKDKDRLDWILNYITRYGLRGLKKLAWTVYDEDGKSLMHRKTVSEDEVGDIRFDRAAIDAARANEAKGYHEH